jgi:hypothetical protein
MATVKLYNLARMTTATAGTGTITLGSAVSSFLAFAAAGVANGETVTYAIEDGTNREIGRGVYTSAGPTLTRSVLKSTNSDNAINLSGAAQVFITTASNDLMGHNEAGDFAISSTTAATSGATGALTVAGGVGIGGALWVVGTGISKLQRTGVGGGTPVNAGGSDANQFLIAGNESVDWRFGFYTSGTIWMQPSLVGAYGTNFGIVLCPNGGHTAFGATQAGNSYNPSYLISIDGSAGSRTVGMERNQVSNTAGALLTVNAGGATAGATNKTGGNLVLAGGVSTGSGTSDVVLQASPGTAGSTSDNTLIEILRALGASGNVKFSNAGSFSANGSVATALGSVGPAGSHTTVQKWLTIVDNGGANLYIPAF